MKPSDMADLKALPSVVITSYLGPKDRRDKRLEFHLRQRQALSVLRPGWGRIVSLCSGYPPAARKELDKAGFEAWHLDERHQKWQKQNMVLERLYARGGTDKAVLFLDDDVLPRERKDTDAGNGLQDTTTLVANLLKDPDQMCGQLAYFSCMGLRFDAFYKSAPPHADAAKMQVVGWAMLFRADCGVLYTEDLVTDRLTGLVLDDYPMKCKAVHDGKMVVKYNRAFFKSLQSTDDAKNQSAWFKDQEHRRATHQAFLRKMRDEYPPAKKTSAPKKGFK